jgi:NlpC/P60 family putative phage cell wall peptidase
MASGFTRRSDSDLRFRIICEAWEWLGTPYHHQARVKKVGVDCAQLVAGVAENVFDKLKPINNPVYSVEWHMHNREELMCNIIESFKCERKEVEDRLPGDILTFQFGRVQSHMGILVNDGQFIHARMDIGKVVLNQLSGDWLERLGRVYKFPF